GLSKSVVVPNGIDLSFIEQRTTQFDSCQPVICHHPYVLALSRIHPKKGFELLIEAFAALKKGGGFGDWRLVFAGDGDAEYLNQLKDLARRKGLSEEAMFVGWIEGDRKHAALKNASLLAMPSYQENFGVSLIEAMAYGVPVLVSAHVNLAPEIEEAGAGWVAKLSKEKLAGVLSEALGNEEERKHRGDNARALAQNFAAPTVAKRLLDLYQSLIDRAK
ncbi:MAG: glycosyltransferase, partial [Acidobacteria bacterium]|nr:glycosyltransferase [Acidobacteriota bacterium]